MTLSSFETSAAPANPEVSVASAIEVAPLVVNQDPVLEQVMQQMQEWYRHFLREVRLAGAKLTAPPSPSEYDDDELSDWSKRFQKWMQKVSNSRIFNAIVVPKPRKMLLRSKQISEKAHATTITLKITTAVWDLFWLREQERIDQDDHFQITETDRQVLTIIATLLGLNGNKHVCALYWKTFQLSPTVWENSVIYAASWSNKPVLFHAIHPLLLAAPVVNLRNAWCFRLMKLSIRCNHTEQVEWFRSHLLLTKEQQAELEQVEPKTESAVPNQANISEAEFRAALEHMGARFVRM